MVSNPVAGPVSAATASATGSWSVPAATISAIPDNGERHSICLLSFNVSPSFPLQNQENPPEVMNGNRGTEEAAVAPGSFDASPAYSLQNHGVNPPQEIVPDNQGSHTIRLFGVNMAKGPEESREEPKK